MSKPISTENAPAAVGPYSQGVETSNLVFVSGQLPLGPKTGKMAEGIVAQSRQSLENVKAILAQCELSLKDVVKASVFVDNLDDFAQVNEVYGQFFAAPYPARCCFEVSRLPLGALVEIEVVAEK